MAFKDWLILIEGPHGIDVAGKRSPDATAGLTDSPHYLREYQWGREEANMVADILMAQGFQVVVLVPEETEPGLAERVRRANAHYKRHGYKKTIFLSHHVNAAGSGRNWMNARGICFYTSVGQTESDKIAEEMFLVAKEEMYDPKRNYITTFDLKDKQKPIRTDYSDGDADREANFYVLRNTRCPAVLIECCFQDNKQDVLWLKTDQGKASCAYIISEGVINYVLKADKT